MAGLQILDKFLFLDEAGSPGVAGLLQRNGTDLEYFDSAVKKIMLSAGGTATKLPLFSAGNVLANSPIAAVSDVLVITKTAASAVTDANTYLKLKNASAPAAYTAASNTAGEDCFFRAQDAGANTGGNPRGADLYFQPGTGTGSGRAGNLVLCGSSGNVGIGVANPSALLACERSSNTTEAIAISNVNAGTAAIARLVAGSAGSGTSIEKIGLGYTTSGIYEAGFGLLVDSGAGLNICAGGSGGLIKFYTNGTGSGNERMRITSGGLVGIGTTAPTSLLSVAGAGVSNYQVYLQGQGTSSGTYSLVVADGSGVPIIYTRDDGGVYLPRQTSLLGLATDVNGKIVAAASDGTLKTNIEPLNVKIDVLEVISQLRGVFFNWNQETAYGKGMGLLKEIGVIAQEVEPYLPQVVRTGRDGLKSVMYDRLVALCLEGLKLQQAQIDELKLKVGA